MLINNNNSSNMYNKNKTTTQCHNENQHNDHGHMQSNYILHGAACVSFGINQAIVVLFLDLWQM